MDTNASTLVKDWCTENYYNQYFDTLEAMYSNERLLYAILNSHYNEQYVKM